MTENDNLNPKPLELSENRRLKFVSHFFNRITMAFNGMGHTWIAFLLSVLILGLIYVAMRVWPFGGRSVLVLDLNGQYVYYFEAIRDFFRGEQGILYSFERALGGEFLGIVAYYLASPFSFITALFPEGMITESILLMLLLKCGLSGFNMCVYLHKSHPTKPVYEVIFSTLYALTAYSVVLQHNTMWFDCVLFFPLILLGIESLIKERKYKLYVLTLAVAVFSNYYIGYMVCIGVAIYFFAAYFMMSPEERNPLGEQKHFIKSLGRMAGYSLIAVGMAMIIILPAYYSLSFGKSTFSNPNFTFTQQFDFLDMVTKLFPASYDTVRREGLPVIYSGLLTLIMFVTFFFAKAIPARKKIGYGILVAIFVFSFNLKAVDIAWHGFQVPNWLNYRYSFMLCFIMIVMAYRAFEHIETIDFRKVLGVGGVLVLLLLIIQKQNYEHVDDIKYIWVSIGCIAVYMILLYGCQKRWLEGSVSTILCIFVLLELFYSGVLDTHSLRSDVGSASRASYNTFVDKWSPAAEYINETDESFYRAEKTTHRKTNDNFTLNLKGLSNSTSTLNKNQIQFLQRLGYSSKSHWSKYLGGTPVSDGLLGVKYLIAKDDEQINTLYGEIVFADEKNGTVVYRNDYALSLGYAVTPMTGEIDLSEEYNPFERMNKMVTVMLGEDEPVELFKAYQGIRPETENLNLSYKSGHKEYKKINTNSDGNIIYEITPVNDCEIYMYIPCATSWAYNYNLELSIDGEELSEYFSNETHRIVSLGHHESGDTFTLDMKLVSDKVYMQNVQYYFYYLDEELYREIMPRLGEGNYKIEEYTDSHFIGTVNIPEDRTSFMLTIPYDEGWKIYVDGKLTPTYEVLDCLTAVDVTAGEHKIELKYDPWCVRYGVTISAVSTGAFVLVVIGEQLIRKKREKAAVAATQRDSLPENE